MKTISSIVGALILFASVISSFAIEGIQVSVQSSNVVLSWPSLTNETYIAQYRHTLQSTDSWATLTNYFPASQTTNITYFIHSNSVDFGTPPSGGGTNTGGVPNPGGTNDYSGPPGTNGIAGTGFYRVVRDGVHMWGITNGMVVSNVLVTSIEFAVDSTDQVVGVTFYDTNTASPITGASAQNVGGNRWLLVWNTLQSFNGDYSVCAELNFASDEPVMSQPVAITVNNVISFPNYFSQIYGDQMWIYATTIPDAAYTLDVYDDNTNYLGTFGGNADDTGTISFLWNLVDDNGDTSDSTNFFGVFTVDTSEEPLVRSQISARSGTTVNFLASSPVNKTLANKFKANGGAHPNDGGSSAASANQLWVKEGTWAPNNNWVICYASLTGDGTVDERAVEMIVGGAGSPTDYNGVLGTLDAYGLHGNLSPGNNAQAGTVFTLQDSSTRGNLLGYLGDNRYENFYYFGHGNDSAISAYNGPVTGINEQQLAYAIGNVPLSMNDGDPVFDGWDPDVPTMVQPTMSPSILHAALHPYRFVWLDACDTGRGNFCEAFGIPAITVSTNFFASAGVESRAFVGFTQETGFDDSNSSSDPNGWPSRSLFLNEFLDAWLSGAYDLNTIVLNAKNSFGNVGYKMDSSVIIYGASDLMRNTLTRP
jgi:hypothetical protein